MAASLSPRLASSSSSPKLQCPNFSICFTPSNLHFSTSIPQLGTFKISSWNGLRHHSMPNSRFILKIGRKRRCKGVYASLFGVGAPEALVIGVVALLVFGPKGLAEVARNLGKTLRDFQPTIRELQEVSRDFKSTLEREIGLDEIQEATKNATRPRPTANSDEFLKANTPYSPPPVSEESLGGEDVKISEAQSEASAAELQVTEGSPLSKESETQEYLKQLEDQVQALLAEKQKNFAPAATEVKFQDTSTFSTEASLVDNQKTKELELEELAVQQHDETPLPTESQAGPQSQSEDTSSFSTEASFVEEKLKTKELESEELVSQPREETPLPTESQAEPQNQSEGTEVTWNSKNSETQEYLKKLEEDVQKLFSEQKQTLNAAAEVKPEDSQEAASVSSSSQDSENQANQT